LDFINTLAIGRDFTDELGGYAEVWALLSPEASPEVTADFGLTYAWSTNTQLDCGINIGVTQAADDLNPFIGISQRF